MTNYLVLWAIDVVAADPEDAVTTARAFLPSAHFAEPDDATIFHVAIHGGAARKEALQALRHSTAIDTSNRKEKP